MKKKIEAVIPGEVLARLLSAAGEDLVLIGGQALAFWVHRYNLTLRPDFAVISADTDFLATSASDRAAVARMATVLQGQTYFPNARALTALVGQAYLDINDDEFINVDVVFKVIGLTQEAIRKRQVLADTGSARFFVMHPLDVLRSRLANLYRLTDKQNPKGMMQLALSIDVAREFIRAEARTQGQETNAGRSPLQPYVSEVERMALADDGRKVAKRFGLHVADAVDPSLIPEGPFWERKWPALSKLMSSDYAQKFSPRTP